jgi:hypothetical protein
MIVFGQRLYGRMMQCGDAYVATRFFHVWFIPLIPFRSQLVLRSLPGGQIETLPTPFHWPSVGLAVLRGWSVFLLLHGLLNWIETDPVNGRYYGPVVSALAVLGLVLGFFVLGRTSATKRAQLETYARVFGHPVDLGLLGDARDGLAAWLRDQLVATGSQYAIHYRATYDPATQWGALALDPAMRDPAYLTNALALARIEASRARGAARAELAQTHDRVWARLQEVEAAAAPVASAPTTGAHPG